MLAKVQTLYTHERHDYIQVRAERVHFVRCETFLYTPQ